MQEWLEAWVQEWLEAWVEEWQEEWQAEWEGGCLEEWEWEECKIWDLWLHNSGNSHLIHSSLSLTKEDKLSNSNHSFLNFNKSQQLCKNLDLDQLDLKE